MTAPKDKTRLAEVDYLISAYFYTHLMLVMDRERDKLQAAQAKEIADYQMSFAGLMGTFASASSSAGTLVDPGMQRLQLTGEHCSKTVEDYFAMCQEAIASNEDFQTDLARIACEWRTAIINEVGRERYDEVSEALGADLALAYVDERTGELMLDKMVRDQMPRSTAEYIIRKAGEGSLLGLPMVMQKSPMQQEIDARGEAMFNPSTANKLTARGLSLGADIVATGGVGSWSALARWIGFEAGLMGVEAYIDSKTQLEPVMSAEECISKAIFESDANVFAAIRKEYTWMKDYEHPYLTEVSNTLTKGLYVSTEKPLWEPIFDFQRPTWQELTFNAPSQGLTIMSNTQQETTRPDVPYVIRPGYEQEYLDWVAQQEAAEAIEEAREEDIAEPVSEAQQQNPVPEQTPDNNSQGWNSMLQTFGLGNMGDIGRNLPYVIATLPDMLVGLFTGKTQSVGLKKDIVPIASVLMGLFIKNPLLKMVLIGMGGANLLNKMGHESLERMQPKTQYLQYPDEPLNPRIVNPMLQGSMLVATIDGVPCTVTIPQNAAEAYKTGALPLNTLCNAILARNDQMQQMARQNYNASMGQSDQSRGLNR